MNVTNMHIPVMALSSLKVLSHLEPLWSHQNLQSMVCSMCSLAVISLGIMHIKAQRPMYIMTNIGVGICA